MQKILHEKKTCFVFKRLLHGLRNLSWEAVIVMNQSFDRELGVLAEKNYHSIFNKTTWICKHVHLDVNPYNLIVYIWNVHVKWI